MRPNLQRPSVVLPLVKHSRRNPRRRASRIELLEGRQLLAGAPLAALHNSFNSRDVNGDGRVSPSDAILVINDLLKNGPHAVSPAVSPLIATSASTSASSAKPALVDVNGDNRISAVDALQVIHFLAVSPLVEYSVHATDMSGNAISTVGVNTQFLMEVDVQDIRNPPNSIQGVYAGYLNVNYDNTKATISQSAQPTFGPLFAPFSNGTGGASFTLDPNGQVLSTGSFGTSITPPATGNAKQLLFTIPVTATAIGTLTFNPSFDSALGHDTLLFDPPGELAQTDLLFTSGAVTVLPTFSVGDVSLAEGNSSTKPFVFNVTLSNSSNQQVTVAYATAASPAVNQATSGVDYQPTSGVLTFAPTVTSMPVTVLVNGDTDIESDELFNLVLSSPSNAFISKSTGVGTILNDDSATNTSNISIGDKQVNNVSTGNTVPMVFTVSLSPTSTSVVTVRYATSDVTATAGQDYLAASGTLTFQPNDSTQFITVTVIGNSQPAAEETFLLTLSSPSGGAALQVDHATGTIIPLVPLPDLFIDNVRLPEGDSGLKDFVFTASLVPAPSETVLVQYATVPGTASAGSDFVATSGTLTFTPSQTTQTITVQVMGDTDVEPHETFTINLTPIQGSVGNVGTGVGTIVNDDGPPALSISDATVIGGIAGSQTDAVFTVTVSAVVTQTVTVGFATQDDTAVAPSDYLARSGDLTFTPGGPTSQTITVPVLGAAGQQPDESFIVNLSSNSQGVVIDDGQAIGTIIRQGLVIAGTSQAEGTGGNTNFLFTVTLGLPRPSQVTVAYSTADGTATLADNDYVPTSGILTFAPNQTTKVITVAVVGDSTSEGNETFQVNLSSASGAAILAGTGTGTIINDDGQAVLIQLRLADASGTPLPPGASLDVNDTFTLQALVQDIQVVPTGIAQAYLDVLYTSNLVQVIGPITYGPNYPSVQLGDTSTAGLINEVGAFGNLVPPAQPGAPQLLFSVPFKATGLGIATFTPDPADIPGNDVQAYGSDDPFPSGAINFVGTEITIGANVLTVDSVSQSEGTAGFINFVFTVTHIPPLGAATVVYSTSDGTAVAGQDYIATSGTLTFDVNDTTKTITVQVVGDALNEADETFFVNLSNGVGATASQSAGVGTILDDDALPGLRIVDASASEGQQLNFVVNMFNAGIPGPSGKTVTVAYHTVDLTGANHAVAGTDYIPVTGTLTFAPGVSSLTIPVTALDDALNEPTETFQIVLSDPVNATVSDDTAVGSILNVQPVEIRGFVYVDNKPDGIKGNDLSGHPEVGIANVLITATKTSGTTSYTQTVLTGADGAYSLIGLPPGTYTITETQPGFYNDGIDAHDGVVSPTNDQYTGVTVGPSQLVTGYNFGEANLRNEFVTIFLNRRALFASAVVTGAPGMASGVVNLNPRAGDVWISFDGGWAGLRTISALFDSSQGSASMTLYNNSLTQIALSVPTSTGAQLLYSGTTGAAYFLKLTGTNPNVSLQMSPPASSSAGPLFAPSGLTAVSTPSVPANSDPPAPTTSTTVTAPSKTITFASQATTSSLKMTTASDATDAALSGEEDWVSDSLAV